MEIFHASASEAELEHFYLAALTSLVATMYPTVAPDEDEKDAMDHDAVATPKPDPTPAPTGILADLLKVCLDELKEPDKSNATPAIKMVSAAIAGSDAAARIVAPAVLEQQLRLYANGDEVARRPAIAGVLGSVLIALRTRPSAIVHAATLETSHDELLSVLVSCARTAASRSEGLRGLQAALQLTGALDPAETTLAIQVINDLLAGNAADQDGIAEDALDALIDLTSSHASAIETKSVPILLASLPEVGPADEAALARARIAISRLARLCSAPHSQAMRETLVIRCLARLAAVGRAPANRLSLAYAQHLLAALALVPTGIRLLPGLFGIFLTPAVEPGLEESVAAQSSVLVSAGRVMTLAVQQLDQECVSLELVPELIPQTASQAGGRAAPGVPRRSAATARALASARWSCIRAHGGASAVRSTS